MSSSASPVTNPEWNVVTPTTTWGLIDLLMVTYLQVKVNSFFNENGSVLLRLLSLLVGFEGLALLFGAGYFLIQIFVQSSTSLSGAIVIFVITLVVALGVLVTAVATYRRQTWVRGAILTWQILQVAVAISFIQGPDFWSALGGILLVLSCTCVILLFSKPVQASTTRKESGA